MIGSSAQGGKEVVVWAQRARTLGLCVLGVLIAASFGLLFGVDPAHANTFTVNSTNDRVDEAAGDGVCNTGILIVDPTDGFGTVPECTLRAAIEQANVNDQGDTVNFHSGLSGTITLTLGELVIDDDASNTVDLIIQGPGAGTLSVSGNDASRVFSIDSSLAHVTISGLTIRDGYDNDDSYKSGGIYNYGTLRLTNSTISGNSSDDGGGINNDGGTLTLTNSTISGNSANRNGGGIFNGGDLTLTNSTISGNSSLSAGGIYNAYDDTATLTNSTISGNTSLDAGGGIYNYEYGTLRLTNSTISDNTSYNGGGVYDRDFTTATLTNTILAGNSASTNPDANGVFTSEGYNLIGNTTGSSGWVTSDLKNVDPLLGPLQDNGGPTKTHALLVGSPALNAIPSGTNGCGTTITTDQRGVARPQGRGCDVGAFESPNAPPTATSDSYSVGEDTTLNVPAPGVLANDTDPDGDALSAAVVSQPTNGTLALEADGSFTYTPNNDYSGPDSFTYKVSDGEADSNATTVNITVKDTTKPTVSRVVPQENATGVGPGANVAAFFSEAMRARSINTNTVKLFNTATNTQVAAVVSYDASAKKAVLNPSANLQLGTRYKAVVSTGAKDVAGNALDQNQTPSDGNQPKVWFFRVRE